MSTTETGDRTNSSNSTASFISALVLGLIVFGALLLVFLVLFKKARRRLFQPRYDFAPPSKRPEALPGSPVGFFRWLITFDERHILNTQGPDAFFFARYLRTCIVLFVPYFLLTWAVIMPLAAAGRTAGLPGLQRFTFGNVDPAQSLRFIGYFIVAIILIFWTFYILDREYGTFVRVRQQWLSSPYHMQLARTRSVLIANVPQAYMDKTKIAEMASAISPGVEQVWLSRKVDGMEKVYDELNQEVTKLENAEGEVITLATKNNLKNKTPTAKGTAPAAIEANDLIGRYISSKKLPSHRRGLLGLFGKKVNTLQDSPIYIQEKEAELLRLRSGYENEPFGQSAFVRFATQAEAHEFARRVKDQPDMGRVIPSVEVVPEDIVWANLSITPNARLIRTLISYALTIGLFIIYLPVLTFVGFITQISTISAKYSWLGWLNSLPSVVIGIIQGVLPPVAYAVVAMLVPIILSKFIKLQGKPRNSEIELSLFTRYWLFQIIFGFLVITLSSGLLGLFNDVKGGAILKTLSTQIPAASTYYLQFIALYALTSFALGISRLVPAIMSRLAFILSGKTPRKTYNFEWNLVQIRWGKAWPPVALLPAVGIIYSVIQPVICVFVLFTMALLWMLNKYILEYAADQPDSLETGGLFYRRALNTIFVGLYVEEILLAVLFLFFRNSSNSTTGTGIAGAVIMIIMIVLTIAFQIYMHFRYPRDKWYFVDPAHPHASSEKDQQFVGGMTVERQAMHDQEIANAGPEHGNTTGFHAQAFDNPAAWKDKPVVWMADDTLGIAKTEVSRLGALRVPASTLGATQDDQGKIHVERGPPDEAWYGGRTSH